MAVPQKTVVADAMKAVRHDMHQKAPDEFSGRQGHDFDLVAIPVVLPFELNLISFYIEQAVVGDSHAMGVAAHVVEDLLWPGKWFFGIRPPSRKFSAWLSDEQIQRLHVTAPESGSIVVGRHRMPYLMLPGRDV